jgi:hypothetical protein
MRDPSVIGLNGFGLEVPDLDVATKFYGAFGLAAERRGDVLALRSPGRPRDEAVISRGPVKRMHHLSFVIRPGDESAFAEDLPGLQRLDYVRREGDSLILTKPGYAVLST